MEAKEDEEDFCVQAIARYVDSAAAPAPVIPLDLGNHSVSCPDVSEHPHQRVITLHCDEGAYSRTRVFKQAVDGRHAQT